MTRADRIDQKLGKIFEVVLPQRRVQIEETMRRAGFSQDLDGYTVSELRRAKNAPPHLAGARLRAHIMPPPKKEEEDG